VVGLSQPCVPGVHLYHVPRRRGLAEAVRPVQVETPPRLCTVRLLHVQMTLTKQANNLRNPLVRLRACLDYHQCKGPSLENLFHHLIFHLP